MAKAYTSLPIQLAASRIWLNEDTAAERKFFRGVNGLDFRWSSMHKQHLIVFSCVFIPLELVATRGWRYDASTGLLYPKAPGKQLPLLWTRKGAESAIGLCHICADIILTFAPYVHVVIFRSNHQPPHWTPGVWPTGRRGGSFGVQAGGVLNRFIEYCTTKKIDLRSCGQHSSFSD